MSFTIVSSDTAILLTRTFTQPTENASYSTTKVSHDFFDISETLFAGLSVLIGCLALIVGLLQLRRYRKRHSLQSQDCVFELEAGYSSGTPRGYVELETDAA
ncbi:uncharacterized protein K460DRAFT_412195 [Cucurbitaria berberidis CBS 394.84]|uniref:Uncharacterized protein n=1 Tax=Cucurbitaria berberidis CBS 394.84 TaxID=1168544 RepID=A0A9P4GPZ7_9PLEO|nr:uncharacterized protein K460DRAFT_412195 [Cucurbitaria berberidis CBS 394.84]KAF1850498.1 hypothetical protein K460DRAFT_412195 [Cucurbitaria berberidis CBS 394.84]